MRSLYTRVLVTAALSLTLTLTAFLTVFLTVGQERSRKNWYEVGRLEIDAAMHELEHGGEDALRAFILRLDNAFGSVHYVMDRSNRDILTGADLTPMLRKEDHAVIAAARNVIRRIIGSETTVVNWSTDERHALVTVSAPWSSVREQIYWYLAIVIATSILNSIIAIRVVRSLKKMAAAADSIGAGNLDVHVSGGQRKDELGNLARAFNAMTDRVRNLVTAERRLLQDVSHELRSPLARLAFASELARTSTDRNAAVDQIRKQIDALTSLVSSLVEISRADASADSDMDDGVAVNDIVQELIESSELHLQERGCRIVADAEPTLPLRGNRALIRRAIDNVLRNAIHHSPAGTSIEVSVKRVGRAIEVAIRDNGCGVPEHLLSRIFEPFYRVDDSRTASTGGTGLGLAIVQRVAEVHAGQVRAENMHPGLKVTLTLQSVEAEAIRPRSVA